MDLQALAPYLAGPGAAVIVLLVVLGALYRLIVKYGMPFVKGVADRHLNQIDRMLEQHKDDSERRAEALRALHEDVTDIHRRIINIENKGRSPDDPPTSPGLH